MDTSDSSRHDRDIVVGLKKKDEQALTWLVEKYYVRLLRFLRTKFWPNLTPQDVEEIVSDTIQTVVDKINQFDSSDTDHNEFRNWIYQIGKNKALDRLRHNANQPEAIPIADEILNAAVEYESEPDSPLHSERRMAVKRVLAQMAASMRDVLILNIVHGFEPSQIAEFSGESSGAVRTRLNRARAEFRKLILEQPEFGDWLDPAM